MKKLKINFITLHMDSKSVCNALDHSCSRKNELA